MKRKTRKTQIIQQNTAQSPSLNLTDRIRNDLDEFVVMAGMEAVIEMLENERTALCGQKFARNPEREFVRGGHAPGELVMGGRRVSVQRPRARSRDGSEALLPSWNRFSRQDPLSERALEQMVIGVSTRNYKRSLEETPAMVTTRGTSKSAVSRRFKAKTQAQLEEWRARDISKLDLVGIMIDGVAYADHIILVALGFDIEGEKHPLGLWEGTTENAATCKALLRNLLERGLPCDRALLFVIDGAKGLRKAIRHIFGNLAMIQRCQVHKRRNIREHLPPAQQARVKRALDQAYRCKDAATAEKLLRNLAAGLREQHPGAAASVEEGLEETLTVKRLGLHGSLAQILSTTNVIENLIGQTRDITHRVKRWRSGTMILRWVTTSVDEASTHFHRMKGYREMPKLRAALNAHVQNINTVDGVATVA